MSNSTLYKTFYNFLLESPPAHITAFSVIYQVVEDDTWNSKDDLRQAVHQAVTELKGGYDKNSEKYQKLDEISLKVSVCSLRNIRKSNQEDELTPNEIETNLRSLKTNLASSEAPYAQHFRKYLKKKKNTSNLSWEVPLASQVICADSEMVKLLEEEDVEAYNFFMESDENLAKVTTDILEIL
ncbi:1860_t:CDS:2 [Racocetra fulgida]|uniref:1860_t:CDS:1 n=1 Tax=Racocetra fulgida TaxID=60492 RepID=A0A9N9DYS2_9GLOM|nr:1860_t:CDS:2 [Racocetra fulgida]